MTDVIVAVPSCREADIVFFSVHAGKSYANPITKHKSNPKPNTNPNPTRYRLIMHRPIGVSAGIVSIGQMPERVVEKFEVGL